MHVMCSIITPVHLIVNAHHSLQCSAIAGIRTMMEAHPLVILLPLVVGPGQPSNSIGETPRCAGLMWMKIGININTLIYIAAAVDFLMLCCICTLVNFIVKMLFCTNYVIT